MRPMRPGPGDPSMATVLSFDTAADKWSVPIGSHSRGELSLQLERLMAGRLLIQGSSGAGKSRTLRKIIEEAFDFTTIILVDPAGEFGNLARSDERRVGKE